MGPWKLIERYEDGGVHLFNLEDDPEERNNLAGDEAERVAAMRARLHEWYREVDAHFLRPLDGGPEPWSPRTTAPAAEGREEIGYVGEADLERWPASIEALRREYGDATLIVPGHGRAGGDELLQHTLDLLAQVE
jgi:hypothetical protein